MRNKRVGALVCFLSFMTGLVLWISLVHADDVYNFYFQKGSAPQSVIQGGGKGNGPSGDEPTKVTPAASSVPEETPSSAPTPTLRPIEGAEKSRETRFTLSLGYGRASASAVKDMNYTLGLKYAFNRYLGLAAQGRVQDGSAGVARLSDRLGGMFALTFMPLHLDLMGQRFMEFSTYGGISRHPRVTHDFSPAVGLTALLKINSTVGVELSAEKSTSSAFIGAGLAFQF